MRSIRVTLWVTLDGVVQGLGRPDEDTRGGFTHGGWGRRYDDEVLAREMARECPSQETCCSAGAPADFTTVWSHQTDGNPFTTRMNATTKYVVSRTLTSAMPGRTRSVRRCGQHGGRTEDPAGRGPRHRRQRLAGAQPACGGPDRPVHAGDLPADPRQRRAAVRGPAPLTEFELISSVPTTKGAIIAQYARR